MIGCVILKYSYRDSVPKDAAVRDEGNSRRVQVCNLNPQSVEEPTPNPSQEGNIKSPILGIGFRGR